jgi:ribosome-associated protein
MTDTIRTVQISTPFIKLDALLKFSGSCATGGEAKGVILDKKVCVNGKTCTERGRKLYLGDKIMLSFGKGETLYIGGQKKE